MFKVFIGEQVVLLSWWYILPWLWLLLECVCWWLVYPGCHDCSCTTGVQPHPARVRSVWLRLGASCTKIAYAQKRGVHKKTCRSMLTFRCMKREMTVEMCGASRQLHGWCSQVSTAIVPLDRFECATKVFPVHCVLAHSQFLRKVHSKKCKYRSARFQTHH